eukprot:5839566-Amphidinium_carterae.1
MSPYNLTTHTCKLQPLRPVPSDKQHHIILAAIEPVTQLLSTSIRVPHLGVHRHALILSLNLKNPSFTMDVSARSSDYQVTANLHYYNSLKNW